MCACNQNKPDNDKAPSANGANAPSNQLQPTLATENHVPELAKILSECTKVEYMVYNAGITFESESNQEVMRFGSYITNYEPAPNACKTSDYDGGVVFKNADGNIKMSMQFNIPALSCNRITFKMGDKSYTRTLGQPGLDFFGQVLNLRNQTQQQMAPTGGQ